MWRSIPCAMGRVVRPAMGLAIKGDHVVAPLLDRLHPGQEATLELLRIQAGKHAPEGIVRGEVEERLQPGPFARAELRHVHPAVGATDDGADGNNDDTQQGVVFGAMRCVFTAYERYQHKR